MQRPQTVVPRRLALTALLGFGGLTACAQQQPAPRGAALPGVAVGTPQNPNKNYYTGADPDFQRQGSRSRGGGQ